MYEYSSSKLDTSKSDSINDITTNIHEKKSLAERKQYLSIGTSRIICVLFFLCLNKRSIFY